MGCYKPPMGSGLIQTVTFLSSTLDSLERKTGQSATEPLLIASGSRGGWVPPWGWFWFLMRYGCFQKWWYPKMDGLWWKTLLKWMIWGYPYFRKHPYIHSVYHPPGVYTPQDAGDNRHKLEGWKVGRFGLLSKNGIIILVATNCMLGWGYSSKISDILKLTACL